ncbi:MAG: hypothetical protein PVG39_02040 [Desulfobacteraceae bacterium]
MWNDPYSKYFGQPDQSIDVCDAEAKEYPIYKKHWDHVLIEFTPFAWGMGIEFGHVYHLALSLWIGPFYVSIFR